MSRDATELGAMTGDEIAKWCAEHQAMVVIEYHRRFDGTVQPVIRAHAEPSFAIDLKKQVRGEAS